MLNNSSKCSSPPFPPPPESLQLEYGNSDTQELHLLKVGTQYLICYTNCKSFSHLLLMKDLVIDLELTRLGNQFHLPLLSFCVPSVPERVGVGEGNRAFMQISIGFLPRLLFLFLLTSAPRRMSLCTLALHSFAPFGPTFGTGSQDPASQR